VAYLSLRYRKDKSILKFNDMDLFSANANLNYNLHEVLNLSVSRGVSRFPTTIGRNQTTEGPAPVAGAQVNAYSLTMG